MLAANTRTAFERAEREQTIRESEQELRQQHDQLDSLNRTNTLVQDLIQELIEAGTREGIERSVCEQLTDSKLYQNAWIAELDVTGEGITPKTGAGVDDSYLEAVGRMPLSQIGDGIVERAIDTGDVTVVRQYQVRKTAAESNPEVSIEEVEATAAVPLTYGDRIHGVLVVNATREDALGEQAQAGLEVLGDAIGFAISAIRREELLLSDDIVELEFEVTDPGSLAVGFSERLECRCRLEGVAPTQEGDHLCYLRVEEASVDASVEVADAVDTITEHRVVSERDGGCLLEVTTTEAGPRAMVDIGASIRTAVADEGEGTIIVEAPQTANIREIVEAFQDLYPESRLVAKREVEQSVQTVDEFRDGVEDRLTEKQKTAVQTAYLAGYYDWRQRPLPAERRRERPNGVLSGLLRLAPREHRRGGRRIDGRFRLYLPRTRPDGRKEAAVRAPRTSEQPALTNGWSDATRITLIHRRGQHSSTGIVGAEPRGI